MYEDYLKDSSSVHKQWRDFFQGYSFAKEVYNEDDIPSALRKEFKVIDLMRHTEKEGIYLLKPIQSEREENILQILILEISNSLMLI